MNIIYTHLTMVTSTVNNTPIHVWKTIKIPTYSNCEQSDEPRTAKDR